MTSLTPKDGGEAAGEEEWRPIETAPKDGTEIQVKIPGHGSDSVISWNDGFVNTEGEDCGCWVFTREQEPPDDWTAGACWEVNEDGEKSTLPTHWKPLPSGQDNTEVLCEDCPPVGYPTDKTRCDKCPRSASPLTELGGEA